MAGADVMCFFGKGDWRTATVLAHNFREPSWPKDQIAAYKVALENISTNPRISFPV